MPRNQKIVARWWKNRGWYVCRPLDFRSPSSPKHYCFFGKDDEAADAAKIEAKRMTEARKSHGVAFLTLPIWQQNELLRMGERIGWNNLKAAADMFEERKPLSQLGISQVAADCLKEAADSGLRKNSLATLKSSLKSFADFLNKPVGAVDGADVKAWIASHPEWVNKTKRGRIVDVSTMFKFAIRQKMVSHNPCDDVKRPKVDQKDHQIFHVSEARVLLETIQKHDVALLGYLCPDLLGGLRPFESKCIKPKNVSAGRIKLDAAQTKKRRARTIHFHDSLRAFMAVPGVKFEHKNLAKRMRKIRQLAGEELSRQRGKKLKFPWAHDIVRHTFCSNAVHEFGFKETSKLACTSEENLRTTYFTAIENLDEVKEFWALRPLPAR